MSAGAEAPGRRATRRATVEIAVALLAAIALRVPFWKEALRTPLDGDEAIVGLMSRHLGHDATIWGQPFGSPLEPCLVAPFVAGLGTTVAAVRVPYFLLGLLLVPLAYGLAACLHPRAALPAALLMAWPAPYLLIVASLATIYPSALVLCGLLLLLALRLGERLARGERSRVRLALWGGLAGLALWTHLMSASVVVASLAYLAARSRRRLDVLLVPALAILVVAAPWWSRGVGQSLSILRVSGPRKTATQHLAQALSNLGHASGGLVGTHTPLIVDEGQHVLETAGWHAALVVLAFALPLAWAARGARRSGPAALLLGAILLTAAAFPFPQRSGPQTIRYLTTAFLPMVALIGMVAASRRRGVGWAVVLAILGLDLAGAAPLLAAWRRIDRSSAPFLLPDLGPVERALEGRGIRRAYASYGPAYRLTYETGERLIVSQPWNERFRSYPLPYLDEVRFAKGVAWILTPRIPSDLPGRRVFEAELGEIGGRFRRTEAGPALIYYDFTPPVPPAVFTLTAAGAAGDGDVATVRPFAPGEAVTLSLPEPAALAGVTLLAGPDGPRLLRSMDVEVSADGLAFERVFRRRRLEEREHLDWINGHPQYVTDNDVLSVPLAGRRVAAVRIAPVGSDEAWGLAELLAHPAASRDQDWSEWLDPNLGWDERVRALEARPLPGRADWYYRVSLAKRARSSLVPRPEPRP